MPFPKFRLFSQPQTEARELPPLQKPENEKIYCLLIGNNSSEVFRKYVPEQAAYAKTAMLTHMASFTGDGVSFFISVSDNKYFNPATDHQLTKNTLIFICEESSSCTQATSLEQSILRSFPEKKVIAIDRELLTLDNQTFRKEFEKIILAETGKSPALPTYYQPSRGPGARAN